MFSRFSFEIIGANLGDGLATEDTFQSKKSKVFYPRWNIFGIYNQESPLLGQFLRSMTFLAEVSFIHASIFGGIK